MTQPATNPTDHDAPAPPAKALRAVRVVIALMLILGVGVFGVFAISELAQPLTPATSPKTFGASELLPGTANTYRRLPGDMPLPKDNPLHEMGLGSARIPIDHHPGKFKPFRNAASFEQLPYREPVTDGAVWEYCAYRVLNAAPNEAFVYYDAQAQARGMKLQRQGETSANTPGGIKASWSDGTRGLELTAWPGQAAQPERAPVRPQIPLNWVVKYSYPAPTDTE